ncbi:MULTISPECIES: hypothetical protein [Caproicibacterium]|uniref:hypothetical protein n=1 Tax=Caproicibacterium TaxID=2834348 RepID=UPI00157299A4|nr:hypothetical protein [Caproicibacterium lactatifermentans]
MPTINPRKHYPFLNEDCFVEVSDEVTEAFLLSYSSGKRLPPKDISAQSLLFSGPQRRYMVIFRWAS